MVFQIDFKFIESLRHCSANQQMSQLTTTNSLSKSDQYCTGRSRFQQVKLVIVTFKRYRTLHTLSLRGYSVIGPAFTVRLRNCRFLFSKSLLVRRKTPTSNFPQTQTLSKGQVMHFEYGAHYKHTASTSVKSLVPPLPVQEHVPTILEQNKPVEKVVEASIKIFSPTF